MSDMNALTEADSIKIDGNKVNICGSSTFKEKIFDLITNITTSHEDVEAQIEEDGQLIIPEEITLTDSQKKELILKLLDTNFSQDVAVVLSWAGSEYAQMHAWDAGDHPCNPQSKP